MMIRLFVTLLAAVLLQSATAAPASASKPNFLVILADDMGFSDAGCYGSEIRTPHIDRLASGGLRFTQFYNTARCWPTRSSLLTGYYAQQIRMDPPRGRLPAWTRLVPHYLKPLGYRCYQSGKWHVQGVPKAVADGGFDHAYVLEDHDRNFYPQKHTEDDQPLPPIATNSSTYYTSTAFADHAIRCLREHEAQFKDRPFFAYLAFTVPHFPLQAPAEDIARCESMYREGWDVVRQRRWERLREMGIVNCALSTLETNTVPHWNATPAVLREQVNPDEVPYAVPWNVLTAGQRDYQARKMAIHAAMIERMDREIGRVLAQLERMGALSNTVVFFASDNGASAEQIIRGDKHDSKAPLGSGGSYLCLGPGWSSAANTPFRLHKSWTHEGGIATPLVVHWPAGIPARGQLRHDPGHVIDLVPTVLELAGAQWTEKWNDLKAPPLSGRSLVPAFSRDGAVTRDALYFHHENNRALRMGNWKLVTTRDRTNSWSLYNLAEDRSEQRDLAADHPERVRAMAASWQEMTAEWARQAQVPPQAPKKVRAIQK